MLNFEVSFLFFSQNEIEVLVDSEGSDSMTDKKDLDPDFLLKIDLTLISFSPEAPFLEQLIFFDTNFFSVSNERRTGNLQDKEVLK